MKVPETPPLAAALSVIIILLLPLAGIMLAGGDSSYYLHIPPVTGRNFHAPFSWTLFILLCSAIIILIAHPLLHIIKNRAGTGKQQGTRRKFPWWGWCGLFLCASAWLFAWTRLPLLSHVQRFTFLPLWISYILTVNAFCYMRTGRSLITHNTMYIAKLFPLSAAFWWAFEYLNRYTANWYYAGTGELTAAMYMAEATLAFSTVLPAVMSTAELIKSFPCLYAGMDRYFSVKYKKSRQAWIFTLLLSSAGLGLLGIFPEILFPLLWISPLLIISSITALHGKETIFSSVAHGDWRPVIIYASAALFCGFFWEMWNLHSMAKWYYSIPYVQGMKIFEMPLPGYAGYLPFGLECAVIAGLVKNKERI